MKLYLKLSSALIVLFISSCSNSPYKYLIQQKDTDSSALRFKPEYEKTLYRCLVNGNVIFKKYHLSGLLLFKKSENGTVRAVFQNEIGITFFDFEWGSNGSFKVNAIINKLDKPVVINVLRKDMEMLLFLNVDKEHEKKFLRDRGKELYNCFSLEKGSNCYVSKDDQLLRIENIGKKNIVTTVKIGEKNSLNSMPNSVFFDHHKAKFTIQLTKIKN
ncbi:MAG: hypothetical protein R2800_03120 [Flavipsychrobacter sp.]